MNGYNLTVAAAARWSWCRACIRGKGAAF